MIDKIYMKKYPSRILVISDLHFPNEHPDAIEFLKAIKRKYKPNFVIQIGDIVDIGSISNYELDPHYISAKDEFDKSLEKMKLFYKIFPQCVLTIGNHEIRVKKKANKFGIPDSYLKSFEALYQMPKNWKVCFELNINDEVLFTHGVHKKMLKLSQQKHRSTVEGHFHTDLGITFWSSDYGKSYFCLRTGCLIDDTSVVFNYNKRDGLRPCLGCAMLINKEPAIIRMQVDKHNRWIGRL